MELLGIVEAEDRARCAVRPAFVKSVVLISPTRFPEPGGKSRWHLLGCEMKRAGSLFSVGDAFAWDDDEFCRAKDGGFVVESDVFSGVL